MLKQIHKEKVNNIKDWFILKEISQGIRLKNNTLIKVLEIKPINFQLLSDNEQVMVLENYRRVLQQIPLKTQIVVVPYRSDVKEHLYDIQKYAWGNDTLSKHTEQYIRFVEEKISDQNRFTRKFFLLLEAEKDYQEKMGEIIRSFNACGNEVTICNDDAIRQLLQVYFKKGLEDDERKVGEDFYPTYLNMQNPQYLLVDNEYVATLFVNHYHTEMEGGFLNHLLSSDIPFILSMFYEKRSTYETLKELTGVIGNAGANIQISGSNQIDIDLMKGTYENAKYIKKQLQVENDELFDLTMYLMVDGNTVEELKVLLKRIESLALGCGLSTRQGIYRQEDILKACLPFLQQSKELKEIGSRNVLASGLVSTYPFLSNELCDKNGVLIGTNALNQSVVMVDRFDTEKYKNGNMCVIGASGSGKSYFMKLMIMRNRLLNMEQYIIDPDREYTKLCEELGGTLLNFGENNRMNIMEIREIMLEEGETFLQNKIQKLMTFFSIIFPDLHDEEKSMLEEKITMCYAQKGITFDNSSLYLGEMKGKLVSKKIFKASSDMPILGDLYKIISKDKTMTRITKLLKPYVSGALKFMNGTTNVNLNNKLVIADIYHVEEKYLPMALFTITDFFWDKIQENRGRKKIIYLDEVWRLIHKSEETAEFVFKIFKTIRKYGGAATAITQDINDFFSLNHGSFGKGILSNASMKCIFQVEENDMQKLREVIQLSDWEADKIMTLERGTCLMHAGRNRMLIHVLSSEDEHQYISTDRKDL